MNPKSMKGTARRKPRGKPIDGPPGERYDSGSQLRLFEAETGQGRKRVRKVQRLREGDDGLPASKGTKTGSGLSARQLPLFEDREKSVERRKVSRAGGRSRASGTRDAARTIAVEVVHATEGVSTKRVVSALQALLAGKQETSDVNASGTDETVHPSSRGAPRRRKPVNKVREGG